MVKTSGNRFHDNEPQLFINWQSSCLPAALTLSHLHLCSGLTRKQLITCTTLEQRPGDNICCTSVRCPKPLQFIANAPEKNNYEEKIVRLVSEELRLLGVLWNRTFIALIAHSVPSLVSSCANSRKSILKHLKQQEGYPGTSGSLSSQTIIY